MNTDMYTKSVLTVIAACLVWLCIKDVDLIPATYAQDEAAAAAARAPIKVEVVNIDKSPVKVSIVDAGDDFNYHVPVVLKGMSMDERDSEGFVPVQIRSVSNGIQNSLPLWGH